MLSIDLDRLGIGASTRVLDIGCGTGRHSFAAMKLGASVVAADLELIDLDSVRQMGAAMEQVGEVRAPSGGVVGADILGMPFAGESFDVVIASEILEHIVDDEAALRECARVLARSGTLVVTVPRTLPEALNWLLSRRYHDRPGGHVRIYRRRQLLERLERAGLSLVASEHRHGLHSPYWWLRCALGVDRPERRPVAAYHRLLVKEIVEQPRSLRLLSRILDPLIGKSLILYLRHTAQTVATAS